MRGRAGVGAVALALAAAALGSAVVGPSSAADGAGLVAPPVLVPIVGGVAGGTAALPPSASAAGSASAPAADSSATPGPGVGDALDPSAVADILDPLLSGGALGSGASPARVVDVATGTVLYDAAATASTPASTVKLVTAVSVLDALGTDATLTTRTVLLDPDAETPRVVLVGGGDPTLASTDTRIGAAGTALRTASLQRLARATRWTLAARGIERVRVGFDDSLFTGTALHPTWSSSFPSLGIVAPVSALVVDQGRADPDGVRRVRDPARFAAELFAEQLAEAGIEVTGNPKRVEARPTSSALQAVTSPPIGTLVERALATSDNDIAESLARVGALAAGFEGSFDGVAERAAEVLVTRGGADEDDVVVDGSGLSRGNALRPATLTGLLVGGEELGTLASGLPVAGALGSLRNRFDTSATEEAAGLVRAKTGTLTGVGALAGYVSRPDGRLLAFAILDDSVPGGAIAARGAMDRALTALVTCDCAAD